MQSSERTPERSETPTSPARPSLGRRRVAMRMVRTPVHGIVLVYEADPVAGENGQRTLVFEIGKSFEQLSQYPEDWRHMSDDDLLALPKAH